MSKIDELLKNEKVEWKRLGEKDVCISIRTGLNPRKNFKLNDSSDGELTSWYITTKDYSCNEVIEFVEGKTARITEKARKLINKRSKLQINDILFSAVGTVGKIAFVEVEPNNFDVNESTFVLKPNEKNIVPKYLVYYLRSDFIQNEVKKSLKGSTLAGIRKHKLEDLVIPIPSIDNQERIVKILDKFTKCITELQAELQTELQTRIKQYEYYRNLLLSEEHLNKLSEISEFIEGRYRVRQTTLGEVGLFTRGNGLQKKDFVVSGNPVIHYGQIYTKYNFETDKTFSFVNDDVFSRLKKAKYNDILIATTSENKEDVGKSVVWLGSEEIGFSGDMYSYRTTENSKYIAYYFQTIEFQKQKEKKLTGTKLFRIHGDDMAVFSISLPPIEIQNKVVEILDKLQSLLSDSQEVLPKEIEQRQKQYEYYREKLLTFDVVDGTISRQTDRQTDRQIISNNYFILLKEAADMVGIKLFEVEWNALGQLGVFENGTGMPKSLFNDNGNVGAIHYGHIYTRYNLFVENPIVRVSKNDMKKIKKVNYGDLVIAKTSENIEDVMKTVAYLGSETVVTGGHAAIFRHNENPKYLSYVFNGANYLLSQKNKLARGVKVIEISVIDMEKIKVPIPSLQVQEYIVSILDKFNELINDISIGIPKEIELRQKQYEYYRERLLDFNSRN